MLLSHRVSSAGLPALTMLEAAGGNNNDGENTMQPYRFSGSPRAFA